MRISDWSSDVCSSDLWKAGGEIRPTEGVSRAKEETPRRSKLSGFVTEGVMEKGADFGILSRSPLMKASGMSDTDDSQTEIEAIDARLPLNAWHRERGARMVSFAGYVMPIQYEGIMAEHLWTREHAGLFDVSHMGQLLFSGEDADKALEALLPGDIIGLKDGRMRYSLLLDGDGGILDDLMVTRRSDGIYIVVNGATKYDDIAYLREHLPDEITINHMDEQALLALQGPKAIQALSRLVAGVDDLVFMQAGSFRWRDHDLWISRSGYTGEDGFEISLPAEAITAFADELCALEEVKPIGLGARDSLRLEAGLPLYGHDLDENTDPATAGLGFAISKRRRSEGGFPGATRILALLTEGADRKSTRLNSSQ